MADLSRSERETLNAAARIKRALARDRRRNTLASRPHEKRSRGRVRDNAHLAFIRRLPCVATWVESGRVVHGCQAAHLRLSSDAHGKKHPGGQVKPDDRWTTPLSPEQHRIQGEVKGEARFWADLGIDPFDLCLRLHAVSGDEAAAIAIIRALRAPA